MNPSVARTALAGLAALAAAMGVGRFAFTPLLPEMQRAGLTLGAAGTLASANYVGYLLGAWLAGQWRVAADRAVRAGILAVGFATLAMGITENLTAWIVLRFAAGVASACVLVFAAAWSLERFQQAESGRVAALGSATLFSGVGVGIALAGIACQAMFAAGASPQLAWIALGIASLAVLPAVWPAFGGDVARPQAPKGGARWNRERVLLVACYGAFGFGYIIPATFIASMARDLASGSSSLAGWVWPLFGGAAAASTFAAAWLRGHFAPRSLWAASHFLMAAGVAAPIAWHSIAAHVACGLLVGSTFMVATMVGLQEGRRVAGSEARALIAAMTTAFALGQIAGPLVVAALPAGGANYETALGIAAALLFASAFALLAPTRGDAR